jgi:hypothetical protein
VCTQVSRHVFALECRSFLVDLGLCAHDDSRDAESTLQAAACRKCRCERRPFTIRDTFECDDGSSVNFLEAGLARNHRLAVDEDGATPALTARRTPILG